MEITGYRGSVYLINIKYGGTYQVEILCVS
jgi:hypothetical protein